MKNVHFCAILIVLFLISIISIIGCGNATGGGGGGGAGVTNRSGIFSYAGTQSPGDTWTWTISTTEYTGTNESLSFTISGTWDALSSGFSKATVTFSSTTEIAAGDGFYFLEIPNTALLVKPHNPGDERPIICTSLTTFEPAASFRFLCVKIPDAGWNPSSHAIATGDSTVPSTRTFHLNWYLITGEFAEPQTASDFTFSDGTFTSTSIGAKVFMTNSNIFVEDDGTGEGGSIGAIYEDLSGTPIRTVLSHTFKGFRYGYDSALQTGETQAATGTYAKIDGFDAWKGNPYMTDADIDNNNTAGTFGVKITFEANPQQPTGFVPGIVTDLSNNQPENVQCVVSKVGPAGKQKYVIFGIGLKNSTVQPFNFILLQTSN